MTLIINLIVSFIMNFFISSFINNDITYNINGFTTRYIVIDRLMHNDFGCYLLFLKTPFIFFFRINFSEKNMYGAKSRPLRFFIVLLHTPRPANSSASIAAHKTDRRRNREGFLSRCYIPGSHCFIQDWIAFIPDCFRTLNACGKRSELTKYGIIIKEVNNTTWLALFIWY